MTPAHDQFENPLWGAVCAENLVRLIWQKNHVASATMVALLFFLLRLLVSPFRPIGRLEAENAALRRQLIVLQRQVRGRVQFTNSDRLFFLQLYRWSPSIVKAMTTIRPETLVRWHRAGFRRYWRWKSRNLGGRPPIDAGLRALIRRMSIENMLWGAPRIQGELLKLGFAVAQSTVAKYMAGIDGRPSGQRWGTFLRNHLPQIAAMDLFVVPTIGFNLLYVLVIVRLARRELVWINVTAYPTAEWIAHASDHFQLRRDCTPADCNPLAQNSKELAALSKAAGTAATT